MVKRRPLTASSAGLTKLGRPRSSFRRPLLHCRNRITSVNVSSGNAKTRSSVNRGNRAEKHSIQYHVPDLGARTCQLYQRPDSATVKTGSKETGNDLTGSDSNFDACTAHTTVEGVTLNNSHSVVTETSCKQAIEQCKTRKLVVELPSAF